MPRRDELLHGVCVSTDCCFPQIALPRPCNDAQSGHRDRHHGCRVRVHHIKLKLIQPCFRDGPCNRRPTTLISQALKPPALARAHQGIEGTSILAAVLFSDMEASSRRLRLLLAVMQLVSAVQAFKVGVYHLQSVPSRAVSSVYSARRVGAKGIVGARMASLAELELVGGVAISHEYVRVASDVTLHVAVAGEGNLGKDAPTICLLHGFPDFWLSWRKQLQGLVEGGYRVVCPDLRGYGKSSKPSGIERYSEVEITRDVEELRKYFVGEEGQFELLVGHDWGAACAWGTMSWYSPQPAYSHCAY